MLLVVEGLRGVEHDEHQRRIGEGFAAAMDTQLLGFFENSIGRTIGRSAGAFAQARGVDELDGNAADGDALGDEVARGAGSCGDNGAVALDEAIEERAFAGVGAADDGEGEAVVDNAAAGKGGFERGERRRELVRCGGQFLLRCDVQIVFGEVDAGFEQRDEFDEGLLYGRDAMAERAAHLAGGLARLSEGLRVDEVADRFSLGEVEAAGEECALREFAGLGEARAEIERSAQQQLQDHRRAVRGNFDQIFGGVGVGRGKECDEGFVDAGRSVCSRARGANVEHIGETRAGVRRWSRWLAQARPIATAIACSLRDR